MGRLIACISCIVLLVAGCQKQTVSPKQKLCVNIGEDLHTLDPRRARILTDVTVCKMMYEGLTRISKNGSVELALANAVEISDDRLTYTFHLRNSVWSDGAPVTSRDFAATWRAILDPRFATDIAFQLYSIKNGRKAKLGEVGIDRVGIFTPDDQTLVVELEQPTPYFLEVCSMSYLLPVPAQKAEGNPNWAADPETFVGNGPFLLKKWEHNDQVSVVKNPRYWDSKAVLLDEISLVMVNGDTEIRMFEENKLDWAGSPLSIIPPAAIPSLKESNQLKINPLAGTCFFRVNTASTVDNRVNPLSNLSIRKALAMAIDRKEIVDHLLQGGQLPALSLVPPDMGILEEGYLPEQAVERSRELLNQGLKELGCTLDTMGSITICFPVDERNMVTSLAIQKHWENILGIHVEISPMESKTFFQRVKEKNFHLARGSWIADFNDPINFLEVFKFKDGSTNNTGWENSKYIDLLNRSAVCRDQDERKRLMHEAEAILMEEMPIIPVFHFAVNFLQNERVKEVALSPIGQIDFRWAHVEAEEPSRPMR